MRRLLPLFILLLAVGYAFGRDEVFTKTYPTQPGKTVTIDFRDVDGDVRIETHMRDEIVFEFTKTISGSPSRGQERYFQDIRPEVRFSENRFQAEVIYPKRGLGIHLFNFSSIKVRSVLKVPVKSDATVKLVDGDIDLSGLEGRMEVRTTDGDIRFRSCRGEFQVRTVDGDIEVLGAEGKIHCETVDGDVTAEGRFTSVQAETTDGDIDLRFQEGSLPSDDCRFHTTDGDVRISIPREMGFRLRAEVGDGRIRSDARFERIDVQKKHRLEAERGRGGALISVRTGDGDVTLVEF
jgi:hypothetical protein